MIDLEKLAREAGYPASIMPLDQIQALERFAALVAGECARIAELESGDGPDNGCCPTYWDQAQDAAARSIRERFGIGEQT